MNNNKGFVRPNIKIKGGKSIYERDPVIRSDMAPPGGQSQSMSSGAGVMSMSLGKGQTKVPDMSGIMGALQNLQVGTKGKRSKIRL